MIINIKGTSGSGKSTLVRAVMARYDSKFPFRMEGRKQPIGYLLTRANGKGLAVIGHYETECGGCDTVPTMDLIVQKVREAHAAGHDVLFEGLLLSAEVNRTQALHDDGLGLYVIGLDVPLELCIDSVNARRQKKTPGKVGVNPKNTESKWKGTKSTIKRLQAAGVPCEWLDRDGALRRVLELLQLPEVA